MRLFGFALPAVIGTKFHVADHDTNSVGSVGGYWMVSVLNHINMAIRGNLASSNVEQGLLLVVVLSARLWCFLVGVKLGLHEHS